mgnify:CR=1 FL=1
MRIVSYFKQVFCQKKSFYGILEGNNQYKIKVVGINHYEQLIRKKLQRRESFYKVVVSSKIDCSVDRIFLFSYYFSFILSFYYRSL